MLVNDPTSTLLDLAIAVSRLYLGVHWATDVAGALAAGLLWLAATTASYELVRQIPPTRRAGEGAMTRRAHEALAGLRLQAALCARQGVRLAA